MYTDQQKHIEHYAMTTDLTASCGVMHHTMNMLSNRFCGRTFLVSRPGFMFCQYMDMLFPLSSTTKRTGPLSGGILDCVPTIDVETAEKREFTAMGMGIGGSLAGMKRMSLMRSGSVEELSNGSHTSHGSHGHHVSSSKDLGKDGKMVNGIDKKGHKEEARKERKLVSQMDGVAVARIAAKECEGKSVRDLSRLWQYNNGRRPAGDGDRLTTRV